MCKTYTKEWIFLNEKKRLSIKGAILDKAQLENYLEKIASDHILTEKSSKETYPLPRLKENFFVIKEVYKLLNEQIKQSIQIQQISPEEVQKTRNIPSQHLMLFSFSP